MRVQSKVQEKEEDTVVAMTIVTVTVEEHGAVREDIHVFLLLV